MLSLRQRTLAVILVAAGGLAWWQQQGKEPAAVTQTPDEHRPDYTVENFSATLMDESGAPQRRMLAREMRHYPNDDSSELDRPVLTLFDEDGPPWLIRSETGWVSADGDEVHLHGEVFIDRESSPTTRPVHLKTRELRVKPREEYAETDEQVRITSEADWLTAMTGMQVWFGKAIKVKLYGRARSSFFVR